MPSSSKADHNGDLSNGRGLNENGTKDFEKDSDHKIQVHPLPAVVALQDTDSDHERRSCLPTCFRRGPVWFVKKYFFQGQSLNPSQAKAVAELPDDAPWYKKVLVKHRRIIGFLVPFTVYYFIWLSMAIKHDFFRYFPEKYFMTITMIFGGLVAGMTSEGGGAVAFPVMTMAFSIKASIARDFSMMIQTTGMSGASFAILFMRIEIEWHAIITCTFGAVFGLLFGLEKVDPLVPPQSKKMFFVSVWFSFAFALFLLNRYSKRKTFNKIQNVNAWKIVVLFLTGVAGGLFTSIAGGGVDICSFSVLTLLFRVSEKVATPTSVVLMATNSAIGVFWRHLILEAIEVETWEYLAVTAPIVVVMAPLGAILGSHFHRLVLASLIYVLDTVSLVSAFIIIRPLPPWLIGMSVGIIVFGFLFFLLLTKIGHKLLKLHEQDKADAESESTEPAEHTDFTSRDESPPGYASFDRDDKVAHINEAYIADSNEHTSL